MAPVLSSRQFLHQLQSKGGFSVRLPSHREPHTGWMVSVHGHEQQVPRATVSAHDISEYRQHHWRHLHKTSRYFGGWDDPGSGKVSLDESERHFNLTVAERRAAEEHQKAIYNLGSGQTVHTAGPGAMGQVPTIFHHRQGRRV